MPDLSSSCAEIKSSNGVRTELHVYKKYGQIKGPRKVFGLRWLWYIGGDQYTWLQPVFLLYVYLQGTVIHDLYKFLTTPAGYDKNNFQAE